MPLIPRNTTQSHIATDAYYEQVDRCHHHPSVASGYRWSKYFESLFYTLKICFIDVTTIQVTP
jgi:hypothetical protein